MSWKFCVCWALKPSDIEQDTTQFEHDLFAFEDTTGNWFNSAEFWNLWCDVNLLETQIKIISNSIRCWRIIGWSVKHLNQTLI